MPHATEEGIAEGYDLQDPDTYSNGISGQTPPAVDCMNATIEDRPTDAPPDHISELSTDVELAHAIRVGTSWVRAEGAQASSQDHAQKAEIVRRWLHFAELPVVTVARTPIGLLRAQFSTLSEDIRCWGNPDSPTTSNRDATGQRIAPTLMEGIISGRLSNAPARGDVNGASPSDLAEGIFKGSGYIIGLTHEAQEDWQSLLNAKWAVAFHRPDTYAGGSSEALTDAFLECAIDAVAVRG